MHQLVGISSFCWCNLNSRKCRRFLGVLSSIRSWIFLSPYWAACLSPYSHNTERTLQCPVFCLCLQWHHLEQTQLVCLLSQQQSDSSALWIQIFCAAPNETQAVSQFPSKASGVKEVPSAQSAIDISCKLSVLELSEGFPGCFWWNIDSLYTGDKKNCKIKILRQGLFLFKAISVMFKILDYDLLSKIWVNFYSINW